MINRKHPNEYEIVCVYYLHKLYGNKAKVARMLEMSEPAVTDYLKICMEGLSGTFPTERVKNRANIYQAIYRLRMAELPVRVATMEGKQAEKQATSIQEQLQEAYEKIPVLTKKLQQEKINEAVEEYKEKIEELQNQLAKKSAMLF